MTLSEFKAWFEGYTDGMGDQPPNAKQWEAIKAKVGKITGERTTYPVFVDRYVPAPWRPYWRDGITYSGSLSSGTADADAGIWQNDVSFDSHKSMYSLGKAEAALS